MALSGHTQIDSTTPRSHPQRLIPRAPTNADRQLVRAMALSVLDPGLKLPQSLINQRDRPRLASAPLVSSPLEIALGAVQVGNSALQFCRHILRTRFHFSSASGLRLPNRRESL